MVRRSSFSRNCRSSNAAGAIPILCRRRLLGYALDDGAQYRVRCLAVGVRVEVEDNAMPQDGGCDGLKIVDAEMVAAAHERQHAPALDQRLGAARRAAVANVLARQLVSLFLFGLGGHD